MESLPLNQTVIFLKAECDFTDLKDIASFYYSLDGKKWIKIGSQLKMAYTLPHFMAVSYTHLALSKLNLKAAIADLEKAKEDISINIASAYLQVLFDQELYQVAISQEMCIRDRHRHQKVPTIILHKLSLILHLSQ